MADASRTRDRLIPGVLELSAMTPAGTLAKARVMAGLFGSSAGRRSRAVQSLLVDLGRVLASGG